MKTKVLWHELIPSPPRETGYTNQIWAVAFRPDGTQCIFAMADLINIYDAVKGSIVKKIRGHKDTVYALAYSKDGQRFASGSKDKTVVIWSSEGDGILKYNHADPIQALCFNPVLQTLASVTNNDFGIWVSDGATVSKTKLESRACCCDWSPDGQLLAIGLFNGDVLIRDKAGQDVLTINWTQRIPKGEGEIVTLSKTR